jgi:hypothetical protein
MGITFGSFVDLSAPTAVNGSDEKSPWSTGPILKCCQNLLELVTQMLI